MLTWGQFCQHIREWAVQDPSVLSICDRFHVNIHFESHLVSKFSDTAFRPSGPSDGCKKMPLERGKDEPGRWFTANLPSGRVRPAFSGSASPLRRGGTGREREREMTSGCRWRPIVYNAEQNRRKVKNTSGWQIRILSPPGHATLATTWDSLKETYKMNVILWRIRWNKRGIWAENGQAADPP